MEIVILTGMSGAGKSTAMRALEDMEYFCIDNLPPGLLPGLLRSIAETEEENDADNVDKSHVPKMAIGIDIRSLIRFGNITSDFKKLFPDSIEHKIIFMEAADDVLVSRYKQSRRNHPLAGKQTLINAIKEERKQLREIRAISDIVIDTTDMTMNDLKSLLYESLIVDNYDYMMTVLVQSFGFKYGIPLDADIVTDVRFLPNPFYDRNLRPLSGLDQPVKDFVLSFEQVQKFLDFSREFYEFSLPAYQKEGKVRLVIAVGCTGGRHRSVALAEEVASMIRNMGYRVLLEHRDIRRDPAGGL